MEREQVFHNLSVSSPKPPPPGGYAPGTPRYAELRLWLSPARLPQEGDHERVGDMVIGNTIWSNGENNLRQREFIIFVEHKDASTGEDC